MSLLIVLQTLCIMTCTLYPGLVSNVFLGNPYIPSIIFMFLFVSCLFLAEIYTQTVIKYCNILNIQVGNLGDNLYQSV